jgi:hypothetical protein
VIETTLRATKTPVMIRRNVLLLRGVARVEAHGRRRG